MMKRFLILAIGLMCFVGCKNVNTKAMPDEVVTWLKQFNVVDNLDSLQFENIDVKVFQTIGEGECLALECSNKKYGWYNGNIIHYMSNADDLIFDDKIIKNKSYLVGTYTYETRENGTKTVKTYMNDYSYAVRFIEMVKKAKGQ